MKGFIIAATGPVGQACQAKAGCSTVFNDGEVVDAAGQSDWRVIDGQQIDGGFPKRKALIAVIDDEANGDFTAVVLGWNQIPFASTAGGDGCARS